MVRLLNQRPATQSEPKPLGFIEPRASLLARWPCKIIAMATLSILQACAGDDDSPQDEDDTEVEQSVQPGLDEDMDGYGPEEGDCNDTDATVYPGALDYCDGTDSDCDEEKDEGDGSGAVWYPDQDSDGYGTSDAPCMAPGGGISYVVQSGDCDDLAASIHPGAPDGCDDGVDQNCDGRDTTCGILGDIPLSEADARLEGETPEDYAGSRLACTADMNADGIDDLVISALGVGSEGFSSGAVYVKAGPLAGPYLLAAAEVRAEGTIDDSLGTAVDLARDLSGGDGLPDLVIGSAGGGASTTQDGPGLVYVFCPPLADSLELSSACVTLVGEARDDYFGAAVSSSGDVNGDGQADLLIGAWGQSSVAYRAGAAYLFAGPLSGKYGGAEALAVFRAEIGDGEFGSTVSIAGDLNGDGFDDVVVGAPEEASHGCQTGSVYVFFGPVTGERTTSQADWVLYSSRWSDQAGFSLSAGGDVNGDGYSDLLIGAPGSTNYCNTDDPEFDERGHAYLVLGPPGDKKEIDLALEADAVFIGEDPGDYAGWSVSIDGDVDGDGHSDEMVGAPRHSSGHSVIGRAYLLYGARSGEVLLYDADARFSGEEDNARAGLQVASVGDLNDDGYDEMLVAAPGGGESADSPGYVYVLLGGPR